MSAHDQMRAMLDQLMGTARDGECTRVSEGNYDNAKSTFSLIFYIFFQIHLDSSINCTW